MQLQKRPLIILAFSLIIISLILVLVLLTKNNQPTEPDSITITKNEISGEIEGDKFQPTEIILKEPGGSLSLRDPKNLFGLTEIRISIFSRKEVLKNKTIHIEGGKPYGGPSVGIGRAQPGQDYPKFKFLRAHDGYYMDLKFGDRIDKKAQIELDLRLNDKANSYLKGSFVAQVVEDKNYGEVKLDVKYDYEGFGKELEKEALKRKSATN